MKVTFLGVNNAFCVGEYDENGKYDPKWQSNVLIEFDNAAFYRLNEKGVIIKKDKLRMVIDFGGDIRHSLKFHGLSMNDIDIWYCSHPHSDHIGGIEGIALTTFFNPFYNETKKDIIQKAQAVLNDMETIAKLQKSQVDFVQKRILTSPLDCDLGYDADTGETM